ncbi:MAG: hypothetical protein HQK60_10770 [Deltaproteobacteria bacterium]|nr:hypothetical protein [Deltaproteobacteria bacterium]
MLKPGSLLVAFMVFSLIPFAFAAHSLNPRGLVAKTISLEFMTMITAAGPPQPGDYLMPGDRDSQRLVISTIIRNEYGVGDVENCDTSPRREFDESLTGQVLRTREKLICFYMKPSGRSKGDLETEFRKLTDLSSSGFLTQGQQAKIFGLIKDFDRHMVEMLTKDNLFELY